MATGWEETRGPATEPQPAAPRGERWWPVAAAIIVVAGLHVALPARYRVPPVWVIPAVQVTLLAILIVGDPGRIDRQKAWLRIVTGLVIAVITLANLAAAIRLVADILTNNKLYANNAGALLAVGGVIWVTNIVAFALWYWDLDRGGAAARANQSPRTPAFQSPRTPAFVFPEMQNPDYVPATWVPRFIDYLFLAFWTATAVSPTDTAAIKPWAKLLMMIEAAASIALFALVLARAINILK
jgi:hypothetical protein